MKPPDRWIGGRFRVPGLQIPGGPLEAVCPAAVAAVVAAEGALPPGSRRHDLPTPGATTPTALHCLCAWGRMYVRAARKLRRNAHWGHQP